MINSVFHASPRRMMMVAFAVVAAPFSVVSVSPVISAAIGVASAHLWLYNLPQNPGSEALQAPVNWVVAASGLGWLMAGMMLLANLH